MLNPRLTDAFGMAIKQEDVPFLIPHLEEDLPLCIDPFLLWKSSAAEDRGLHEMLLAFFDRLRELVLTGNEDRALSMLLRCHEAREIGLGYAQGSKRGQAIGPKLAKDLLDLFTSIPQLSERSFLHMEEIQLLVPGISEDRLSDIAASILKQSLINFSESNAKKIGIPTRAAMISDVFDGGKMEWSPGYRANLPYNPQDGSPVLLVPVAWLRRLPWINYSDYYRSHYSHLVLPPDYRGRVIRKEDVMAFNRANYRETSVYVKQKESSASRCFPEYFFSPVTLETQQKWFGSLRGIPAGVQRSREYEECCFEYLRCAFFPELEYAKLHVRTESGVHIRDIIFYNDSKTDFLAEMRQRFGCLQVVAELKNVSKLETEHVNQLFRYLGNDFGSLGILVTRNPPPRNVRQNIMDLHAAKRIVILTLDDSDLEIMLHLLEANRRPVEVLKKKFVEFQRLLPC